MSCKHPDFNSHVVVNRLEDQGRFAADITIACAVCGTPMRFLGLPIGVDLNSASTSLDGTEGRFGIHPKGEVVPTIQGPEGFTVRKG